MNLVLTRQWLAAFACNLSVAMTGTTFVWMAPLMVTLTLPGSPLPMTTDDTSWISASIEFGAIVFIIPAGILADRWGRKTLMIISCPLCLMGWILVITTKSVYLLHIVRFLHGMGLAICFTAAPIYLAEIAEPEIRGKLSGQFQAMWFTGCLFAYVMGSYLSYDNYASACAVIPIVTILMLFYVPESPYFLLMVDKDEESMKALSWLRGGVDVKIEFDGIKSSVTRDLGNQGSWKDLFLTKKERHAFLIVQLVSIVKCLGGISAISLYLTQTFEEEFGNSLNSHIMTIILSSVLVITTFFASLVTDRIGRKPLLVLSSAGASFFLLIVAVIYFMDSDTPIDVKPFKWISFVSLICYCVVSNIGLGPLMQTIQAEYFPSHTRGIGGGITGIIGSFIVFCSIKQYQIINDVVGVYMNYVIFFFVSFVGTILFAKVLPETAGKSLGQIQDSFGQKQIV